MTVNLPRSDDERLAIAIRRAFAPYHAPVRDPSPRSRHAAVRAPHRLASFSAAIGLVILVAVVAQSLAQPISVFASWTAVPSAPDPALAAEAGEQCRAGMAPPPADAEGNQALATFGDPTTFPLVALDQRGQVALALFSNGRSYASCMVISGSQGGSTAVAVGAIEGPRTTAIRVLSGMAYEGEPPLRMVVGDVSEDVTAVTIRRADGVLVSATVTAGYFLAWWPTADDVTSITAYDATGASLGTREGGLLD